MEYIKKNDDSIDFATLKKIAKKARSLIIRMTFLAQSGHPGGSLSIIDILTYLYFKELNISPDNQSNPERDYVIMSKGHASPAIYSILALKGFFPPELLDGFRQLNSKLEGHVHKGIPGIEASTGSLGQGLGIGVGLAIASRLKKIDNRVVVILGDGEIEEGSVWESVMAGSKYHLENLIAVVDRNGVQLDGFTKDIMPMDRLKERFETFGWDTIEFDGHDFDQIEKAFRFASQKIGKPKMLIANTVKGKGVSYMENNPKYHGSPPANQDEYERALREIEAS